MINFIKILNILITLIITLILPLVTWYLYSKKHQRVSGPIIAGGLAFYLTQMVIRIPLITILASTSFISNLIDKQPFIYSLYLGISAALFELAGRIIVILLLKRKMSYQFAFSLGFGHGICETVFLVGFIYLNNLIIVLLLNYGNQDLLLGLLHNTETIEYLKNVFISTDSITFLLAGIERILSILFHISMSIILCYGYQKKKFITSIMIVFILHSFIDTMVTYFSLLGLDIYVIELFVLLTTLMVFVLSNKLKNKFDKKEIPLSEAEIAINKGY